MACNPIWVLNHTCKRELCLHFQNWVCGILELLRPAECRKSESFPHIRYQVYWAIPSRNPDCNKLRQISDELLSIFIHVAVECVSRGLLCTFSKCRLNFTHRRVILSTFTLWTFFYTLQQYLFARRPYLFRLVFLCNHCWNCAKSFGILCFFLLHLRFW